jgi:hypothetical protein
LKERRQSSAIRKWLPSNCAGAHGTHPGMIQRNCKQSSDKSTDRRAKFNYNRLQCQKETFLQFLITFHVRPKS